MSNNKATNPLSKPLALVSMSTLVATAIPAFNQNLEWLMAYIMWAWVASFALCAVWAFFSMRLGVTFTTGSLGRLAKVYKAKELKLFYFLISFYFLLGSLGFLSLGYVLLSRA